MLHSTKISPVVHTPVTRFSKNTAEETNDCLACEEPMEILLSWSNTTGRMQRNIAVTMRTPGNDNELAIGFLFSEGIIKGYDCVRNITNPANDENRVLVTLKEGTIPQLQHAQRNFYSTSSCGICGKASIEAIQVHNEQRIRNEDRAVQLKVIYDLPSLLNKAQHIFNKTGGIHASALFSEAGNLILLREDVGRHNALDKLIGRSLMDQLSLPHSILLLSGRASFELIQKATVAGITIVAAIGAPSSLAVDMALESGITLAGFLRNGNCNIYSGVHRIKI